MDYLNLEELKKIYLVEFTQRLQGENTIDEFRRIVEEDEEKIRESYSDSTTWIQSPEFVEMIIKDSAFIIEFILRVTEKRRAYKIRDPLVGHICLIKTVTYDLMLLENQIPYFVLERLFDSIIPQIRPNQTLRQIIIFFLVGGKIRKESTFKHFTDLIRSVRVGTLHNHDVRNPIKHMHNVFKLHCGGVKFEAVEEENSLHIRFENGFLKIPSLRVDDTLELTLRNVMALEQCHYPFEAHVCSFICFMDYLVDNDNDVNLLVEKGILENWIGQPGLVAKMFNKLCLGVFLCGSYYSEVVIQVHTHYSNPVNRACSILKTVYFGNMWTATATIAATLLLMLTLIQTVASIIQVMQNT